ncbi:ankyrin repeat-containing domain protein [Mycena metata]|uniref:protein S-acyltransferase n=1 Tax=Mycena metata TaxID=1033252 RepID=A0AAD7HDD7_9AGAR|nr:ankyrin repeat-containing domain protein [Mycena metata]
MPRRAQPSFDHHGLHQAALTGDEDGVRRALRSGASVNDLDSAGRTAIMCALAGENWQDADASNASFTTLDVVRTLLGDSQMSLFTLNAPQMAYRGVTPLGMAAWLNMSGAVRVLLEESSEYVSVDGIDVHGATPLMYAARDGRLEVVQILLRHGARPDLGDGNHRTSVQFGLPYPQLVWLCETALRRHRCLESQSPDRNRIAADSEHLIHIASSALSPSRIFAPPPLSVFSGESSSRLTATLIQSVLSSDVATLHSLLFERATPPSQSQSVVLVNLPDTNGWSAIHYCASVEYPSISIVDALYCAGAVTSLFTAEEHWTPLHCFAQSLRRLPHARPDLRISLYQFINHLVHDLRTPLAARDKQDETCIHIAAERGTCIEVLALLLDCDTSGTVRELRNARGLTALEVCKPEFRAAFGEQLEDLRSGSSLSSHTIRPSASLTSLVSLISSTLPARDADEASLLDNLDISTSTEQLLANLRLTSPSENHNATPFHLNFLDNLIREAADITAIVSTHYRTMTNEATKDVQILRRNVDKMQVTLERACRDVEEAMRSRGLAPIPSRRRVNRESEDSQTTAVDADDPSSPLDDKLVPWPQWQEGNMSAERIVLVPSPSVEELNAGNHPVQTEEEARITAVESTKPLKRVSGTTKLKAWMKRKLDLSLVGLPTTDQPVSAPQKLEVILEQVDDAATVAVEAPRSPIVDLDLSADAWIDGLLRTSHASLQAAGRDLDRIRECITSAEHFIALVDRCATRAERVAKRALKKREATIAKLRLTSNAKLGDDFFVAPGQLSTKSSIASLSSMYSARSSISLAATQAENEDEDTRIVRRLLSRKINTGTNGAQEQLEKGANWLRTVKEVVRGAKKRAYI